MSNYRRFYVPGGTYFFTIVTHQRKPYFDNYDNIDKLRTIVATVKKEMPFNIIGAVILPDHLHFLWTLPPNAQNYSKRIGRMKMLFTKSFRGNNALPETVSTSRQKHRESNVWQRRFWEHTIQDESELETYLNYIHYNPVKHGLVSCPHLWLYSSFHTWVKKDGYSSHWGCVCQGKLDKIPNFDNIKNYVGE